MQIDFSNAVGIRDGTDRKAVPRPRIPFFTQVPLLSFCFACIRIGLFEFSPFDSASRKMYHLSQFSEITHKVSCSDMRGVVMDFYGMNESASIHFNGELRPWSLNPGAYSCSTNRRSIISTALRDLPDIWTGGTSRIPSGPSRERGVFHCRSSIKTRKRDISICTDEKITDNDP